MRTSALAVSLLLAVLPRAGLAQEKMNFDKIQVKATKVAGQVYVIEDVTAEFSGGNIGVSAGPDGIVLIDDKFAPLAPKIEAALKTISDKPVRFVINTHYHGDHTNGNIAFGAKSTIIAHDNTRKRMMAGRGTEEPPAPAVALPIITFEHRIAVNLNGEDIRAIHFPNGHTDTDLVIFFTKSNVVHMGDDFFNGIYPFIDSQGGGSAKGLIANIEKLLTEIPADAKIIPGHGKISTSKELREFLDMLKGTTGIIEAGIKANKTVDQLKKEKAFAKYERWSKGFFKSDDFIDMLYKDLKR